MLPPFAFRERTLVNNKTYAVEAFLIAERKERREIKEFSAFFACSALKSTPIEGNRVTPVNKTFNALIMLLFA